jgi:ornithine cyclodeaminase/alanine dehydrogenase-like protein (mu-crystallin family)
VFAWEEVRVWCRTQATLDHFIATQQLKFPKLKLKASTTLPEVVSGADVVVTVTPARGAIVMNEWITAGTHIAALGADKGGDQELDPKILQRARIFVDDIRLSNGRRNKPPVAHWPHHRERYCRRDRRGHYWPQGWTDLGRRDHLFDSTGIALQDSATCRLNTSRAVAAGVGVEKR